MLILIWQIPRVWEAGQGGRCWGGRAGLCFLLIPRHFSVLSDSAQTSLSSRAVVSLDVFSFGGFFNHWVSGAVFPRHLMSCLKNYFW